MVVQFDSFFASASAFCNAGFSLYRDSFVLYREGWIVNGVLSGLIIIGGIGFVVIAIYKKEFLAGKQP